MSAQDNKGVCKYAQPPSYSKKQSSYFVKRSVRRREQRVKSFLKATAANDLTLNFGLTIVWHALENAGDRREGHILGMKANKRQHHFMRKLRTLAKQLGFKIAYFWVASVGRKMGNHLHMAFFWRSSSFLDLVALLQTTLGSDVNHEASATNFLHAISQCRGWEVKQIPIGTGNLERWSSYLAHQRIKHNDFSSGRRLGFSQL